MNHQRLGHVKKKLRNKNGNPKSNPSTNKQTTNRNGVGRTTSMHTTKTRKERNVARQKQLIRDFANKEKVQQNL